MQLRNIIEFDGGVTDTALLRGGADADMWSTHVRSYRFPVGSQPQARIPTQSSPAMAFDIKYYSRDVRKNAAPGDRLIDASFSEATRGLLDVPALVPAPTTGSPGAKNPDVERYDPSGLRSAMTTNHAAVARSLAQHRGTMILTPAWARDRAGTASWVAAQKAKGAPVEQFPGVPRPTRVQPWSYTHSPEW